MRYKRVISAAVVFFVLIIDRSFADTYQLQESAIRGKKTVVAKIQLNDQEPRLQLFWKNSKGEPFKNFAGLTSWLGQKNRTLLFASNSGIYRDTPSFSPIGLHIENGSTLKQVSFARNCGNFCWYSGIFLIENNQARIIPRESAKQLNASRVRLGLQSGPLLMMNGKMQGSWSKTSFNFNRSAICTTGVKSQMMLVLVQDGTNFEEFFHILKDAGCTDALFLDGNVSSLHDAKSKKTFGNAFETYAGILAMTALSNH